MGGVWKSALLVFSSGWRCAAGKEQGSGEQQQGEQELKAGLAGFNHVDADGALDEGTPAVLEEDGELVEAFADDGGAEEDQEHLHPCAAPAAALLDAAVDDDCGGEGADEAEVADRADEETFGERIGGAREVGAEVEDAVAGDALVPVGFKGGGAEAGDGHGGGAPEEWPEEVYERDREAAPEEDRRLFQQAGFVGEPDVAAFAEPGSEHDEHEQGCHQAEQGAACGF